MLTVFDSFKLLDFNSFFDCDSNCSKFILATNIRETDGSYFIEIDLPGVEPKDVDISAENSKLIVKGTRNRNGKSDVFSKSFLLPQSADIQNISATYKNGVLQLNIKKRQESLARKIPIIC